MANKYVLGVDGGGTKTHCALFDTNGNKIDVINWKSTNHEVLENGYIELEDELRNMIHSILDKNNILLSEIDNAVFGLAGVDMESQRKIISDILNNIGLKKFYVCNDAYLGIKAGCKKGYGICSINGTGCTVTGIDKDGNSIQIGGLGGLTGDRGGGQYLGNAAIISIYNSLFKCGRQTMMKDILFRLFKIDSKYDFIETVTHSFNSGVIQMKELNKIIFTAANMGDEVALRILEDMGNDIGDMINGAIKELKFKSKECISIVFAGSIYLKGESNLPVEVIKAKVKYKYQNYLFDFKVLDIPPVAGAVIWALSPEENRDDIFDRVTMQILK